MELQDQRNEHVSDQLLSLACGPNKRVFHYTSYLVNGWRFNTKGRDKQLQT